MKKHLGTISALMCALLLAIPAISTATVNNDQVTSIKLKEADNNGSQDTNSGSGVKTGHIQNNAVTNDKIQDGTISSGKLAFAVYTKTEVDTLIAGLQAQITALATRVTALENNPALALGSYVSVTSATVNGAPGPNLVVTGANLHILNGTGTTGETINGLGNLIVGYNELRGSADDRTGSHNIVVGTEHNYSAFGGIVTGAHNGIAGWYSIALGGVGNVSSSHGTAVIGGQGNSALNMYDSVFGGSANTASGSYAVAIGGISLTASGPSSLTAGGFENLAAGNNSSVTGGWGNTASGTLSSVSGGTDRTAGGYSSWAAGSLYEAQ